jgi:hypothetical protein
MPITSRREYASNTMPNHKFTRDILEWSSTSK